MNHTEASINFDLLVPSPGQVRTTPALEEAHKELVASIRAHGLINPLLVRADGDAYRIVAGNRRYAALHELVKAGEMDEGTEIPCMVINNGHEDTEYALAENSARVAMHPADEATAFVDLAAKGASAEDIGLRFGVNKRTVQQRLRLGTLAPPILAAYRDGKLKGEEARAFATTADHERQLAVFGTFAENGNRSWSHTGNILTQLQENRMRSDSELASFVGSKAYHAAGGASEPMLFEDYSTFLDTDLVERLARKKLQKAADRVLAEGWKWVEVLLSWDEVWKFKEQHDTRQIYGKVGEPTPEERAAIDSADQLEDRLQEEAEASGDEEYYDNLPDEQRAEYDQVFAAGDNAKRAIRDRGRTFSDEDKAAAGVLVYLDRGGSIGKVEGLILSGDPVPAGHGDYVTDAKGTSVSSKKKAKEDEAMPQSVKDTITELRSAVLRAELRANPAIAQDLLTFNLVLSQFTGYNGGMGFYPTLPLAIRRDTPSRYAVPGASEDTKAYLEHPEWKPPYIDPKKTVGEMFEAYRKLSDEEKALITAEIVTRQFESRPGGAFTAFDVGDAIADELGTDFAARLLEVDAAVWSTESFWNRLKKDQIITEAGRHLGDEWIKAAKGMKKKELAASTAELMREHKEWLPEGFELGGRE